MKKESLWEDQSAIDDFLSSQEIGHISTVDEEGWPYTVPVNYIWHGGAIYIHGGLGLKVNNLRNNSKACFVVTEALGIMTVDVTSIPCKDTQLGRSVILRGHLREVKAPDPKLRLLNKLTAKYDQAVARLLEEGHVTPERIFSQATFDLCIFLEMKAEAITARQRLLNGKPEKYRKAVAAYFQKRGRELNMERDYKTALLISRALEKERG